DEGHAAASIVPKTCDEARGISSNRPPQRRKRALAMKPEDAEFIRGERDFADLRVVIGMLCVLVFLDVPFEMKGPLIARKRQCNWGQLPIERRSLSRAREHLHAALGVASGRSPHEDGGLRCPELFERRHRRLQFYL